jgi:hypothetical protein
MLFPVPIRARKHRWSYATCRDLDHFAKIVKVFFYLFRTLPYGFILCVGLVLRPSLFVIIHLKPAALLSTMLSKSGAFHAVWDAF